MLNINKSHCPTDSPSCGIRLPLARLTPSRASGQTCASGSSATWRCCTSSEHTCSVSRCSVLQEDSAILIHH